MGKMLSAFEARRRFEQLIGEAFYKHDHFIVERSGRPMAVIVSIGEYERWRKLAKGQVFEFIERAWEHTEGTPPEELEHDVAAAMGELGRDHANKPANSHREDGPNR